ncbi:uncharacterized protein PG998_004736 [Apiospora kogelbergensis]|uniref:Uncharacterized protein n=1 Tax=Apiospora kogelbergensis TaxID=1337665 RepID=A0AAW0Q9E8_9PEZI
MLGAGESSDSNELLLAALSCAGIAGDAVFFLGPLVLRWRLGRHLLLAGPSFLLDSLLLPGILSIGVVGMLPLDGFAMDLVFLVAILFTERIAVVEDPLDQTTTIMGLLDVVRDVTGEVPKVIAQTFDPVSAKRK